MQTPEEFSEEIYGSWTTKDAADLIRARDAEVAETARAENARLREGIAALHRPVHPSWVKHMCRDLLNNRVRDIERERGA